MPACPLSQARCGQRSAASKFELRRPYDARTSLRAPTALRPGLMDIHEISGGVRENGRELPSDACADGVATEMAALTMPDGDCIFHTQTETGSPAPSQRWENVPPGSGLRSNALVRGAGRRITSISHIANAYLPPRWFCTPRGRCDCGIWDAGNVRTIRDPDIHPRMDRRERERHERAVANLNVNFAIMHDA